jgi:restriction endonuclease Mrr
MDQKFPSSKMLLDSLVQVLKDTNVPLSSSEIDDKVITKLKLPDEITKKIRQGNRTEIKYRLAWCRTKAKQTGLIKKNSNNSWQLIED